MHRRTLAKVQEPLAPNLIPMIDVMFLLLLFFLLGADMAARETETMELAVVPNADELDDRARKDAPETIVNVHHASASACTPYANGASCRATAHWKWSLSGREYARDALAAELRVLAELSPEDHVDRDSGKVLSRRMVLIRADRAAPYGDVQWVIESCGRAGLHQVAVVGALPTPD